jgi:hypothetical protein
MNDAELDTRQDELQRSGRAMLESIGSLLAGVGPPLPTGSFVSGLMVWPELDVMVLGGPSFAPHDVLALLGRAVDLPGLTGFHYTDERGPRSPTGERRDERFHVTLTLRGWRIDLSVWLHDDHANVTAYHEELARTVTAEQRAAILRIKDVWHRRPEYPDEIGGLDVYQAVLDHGVRTPEEFAAHVAAD